MKMNKNKRKHYLQLEKKNDIKISRLRTINERKIGVKKTHKIDKIIH